MQPYDYNAAMQKIRDTTKPIPSSDTTPKGYIIREIRRVADESWSAGFKQTSTDLHYIAAQLSKPNDERK